MATDIRARLPYRHSAGIVAVEFALVFGILLTMLFGVMEFARMMYLWNTLQESSRRAARTAAVTDFSDPVAVAGLRRRALFRGDEGALPLAPGITTANVHIDYLSQDAAGTMQVIAVLPGCPARNAVNCASDPTGNTCIRFVRVRLCGNGAGDCPPLPYEPLVPLVPVPTNLPPSTTVVRAESLGFRPGMALCL